MKLGNMSLAHFIFHTISPLIGGFIIFFNSIEICMIFKRRKLRVAIYHLNLSISDICLGFVLVGLTVMSHFHLETNSTILSDIRKVFRTSLVSLSLLQSLLSITLLTVDRVLVIQRPIFYKLLTIRQKTLACVTTWLLTILLSTFLNMVYWEGSLKMFVQCIVTLATILFISLCYVYIWKKIHMIAKHRMTVKSFRRTEEMKFLKLCFKTYLVFLVCWLPYVVMGTMRYTSNIFNDIENYINVNTTIHTVAFTNSLINPITFIVHSFRMRRKVANDVTRSTERIPRFSLSKMVRLGIPDKMDEDRRSSCDSGNVFVDKNTKL